MLHPPKLAFPSITDLQTISRHLRIASDVFNFGGSLPIVAGGAPRDILHGKPVKDIDCFIRVGSDKLEITGGAPSRFIEFTKYLKGLWGGEIIMRTSPSEYGSMVDFAEILNSKWGVPVQLIGIEEDPIVDLFEYDFGLSQLAVTPAGVLKTDAYITDDIAGTLTYLPQLDRTEAQHERSRARYLRLREKYPERQFVGCESLSPKELS